MIRLYENCRVWKIEWLSSQIYPMRYPIIVLTILISINTYGQKNPMDTLSFEDNLLPKCLEIPPEYPGGFHAIQKLLRNHVRFIPNFFSIENCTEIKVRIVFMVDTLGEVRNIRVLEENNPEIITEASRLIRLLNGWTPATLNGKKIEYTLIMPIAFIEDRTWRLRRIRAFFNIFTKNKKSRRSGIL